MQEEREKVKGQGKTTQSARAEVFVRRIKDNRVFRAPSIEWALWYHRQIAPVQIAIHVIKSTLLFDSVSESFTHPEWWAVVLPSPFGGLKYSVVTTKDNEPINPFMSKDWITSSPLMMSVEEVKRIIAGHVINVREGLTPSFR